MKPTIYWPAIMFVFASLLASKVGLSFDSISYFFVLLPFGYFIGLAASWWTARKGTLSTPFPKLKALLALTLSFSSVGAIFAHDLWSDRQHKLVVSKPVLIFSTPEKSPTTKIGNANPGEELTVLRIRSVRDGMAIKVILANGSEGWVFAGDGASLVPKD